MESNPIAAQSLECDTSRVPTPSQPNFWTVPKGTVEPGDTAMVTALKEARAGAAHHVLQPAGTVHHLHLDPGR